MAKWIIAILIAFGTRFITDEHSASTPIRSIPDVAGMHNIFAIGKSVFSGSQPEGLAAFEALSAMGVGVVVSVDGSVPDVAAARRAGLQYIHIPIGYDGIHRTEQLALSRVLAENSDSPIFVHCHHGRHRGPAAVAVACRMNKLLDEAAARSLLEQARTGKEYAGLWESVRTCQAVRPGETLPPLKESVTPPEVVAMMKQIEEQFDTARRSAVDAKTRASETRTADFVAATAVLSQLYRETARLPDARSCAADLIAAANDTPPVGERQFSSDTTSDWISRMEKRCTACHQKHRDNSESAGVSESAAGRTH